MQDVGVGLRVRAGQREGTGAVGHRHGRGQRGRRGLREKRGGEHDDGRDAALLLLPQPHPRPVPVGEPGDDVEAEPEAVLALLALPLVRRLRVEVGEAGVEPLEAFGRHADALVLDGEHHLAVLQQPAGDLDGQVGRREGGGVLQQFGQQVGEVVGGEPGHVGVRRQRGDPHPLVPLDLADRGPDHVDQRHRRGAVLDVLGAGEDEEVLAVPAHDRGEVVELEQGGEPVRVLLALLQVLDDGELPLDQAEGAQREADEGGADALAHRLEPGGRLGEFGAQFLAGVGHLLPLADEVLAVGLQRGDPSGERGGVRVQGVDGADDLRELVVAAGEGDRLLGRRVLRAGQPGRAPAQDRQRAGEGAGQGGGDADGEQDEGAEDGDPDLQRGDVVVAELLQRLDALLVQGGLRAAHRVDAGGERGVQPLGAGAQVAVGERRLVGEAGEVLLGAVHVGPGDGGVEAAPRLLGGALAEVGEGGVGADPGLLGGGGERVALLGVGLRGGRRLGRQAGDRVDDGLGGAGHVEGREQQTAGGGGLLDGGVQFGEGVRAGARAGRHLLAQLLGQGVEFGDRLRVRLVGLQRGALAAEGRPAQRRDGVEVLAQGGGHVGVGAQFLDLAVDAGAALLGGRLGLGAAGRDVGGDLVALVGEGVGEGQRALGLLGERHQFLGVVQLAGGGQDRGRSGPGDGGRHDRHGDDQAVAYVGGTPRADGCLRRRRGGVPGGAGGVLRAPRGGRLLACATRPRLLHRCSHS